MTVFCDTSVLVAACIRKHPHYERARPILETLPAGGGRCTTPCCLSVRVTGFNDYFSTGSHAIRTAKPRLRRHIIPQAYEEWN